MQTTSKVGRARTQPGSPRRARHSPGRTPPRSRRRAPDRPRAHSRHHAQGKAHGRIRPHMRRAGGARRSRRRARHTARGRSCRRGRNRGHTHNRTTDRRRRRHSGLPRRRNTWVQGRIKGWQQPDYPFYQALDQATQPHLLTVTIGCTCPAGSSDTKQPCNSCTLFPSGSLKLGEVGHTRQTRRRCSRRLQQVHSSVTGKVIKHSHTPDNSEPHLSRPPPPPL